MAQKVLLLIAITLIPTLELRASIPYGYWDAGLPLWATIVICVLANIALAPAVWLFVDKGVHLFLHIRWVEWLWLRLVERARKKLHHYVERWGTIGLAIFIGIPLPGSGVYTGGLGAYLLGFGFRQYLIASVAGVLIAATLVTAIVVSGAESLRFLIKAA